MWKDFDAPYFNDYQAFSTVDEFLYSDRAASFLSDIADGKFVLLASDASYAKKSWQGLILPGISLDKDKQMTSLKWAKEESQDPNCLQVIANHDTAVEPGIVEF